MDRLTNRLQNGTAYVVSETGTEGTGHFTTQRRLPELISRLASYEDTGLTPEEINKLDTQRKAMAALADSYKAEIPCWIPVSDRLPESSQRVIVCRKDGRVEQGVYLGVNGWWKVYGTNTKAVTHWMPMPAPPEEALG